MNARRSSRMLLLTAFALLASAALIAQTATKQFEPTVGQAGKDVVWVPTPQPLVEKMLDLAKVTPQDFLMDLGSGDGRTVITAAKRGLRAQGVEYNPDMVDLSKRNAAQAGVGVLKGLVFFGYPLHPPGRPEQMRDAHLPGIREPMLFIQGGRDPFGGGDEIRALLPRLQRPTLHEIEGGDHSFRVPGGKARQQQVVIEALDAAAAWMRSMSA